MRFASVPLALVLVFFIVGCVEQSNPRLSESSSDADYEAILEAWHDLGHAPEAVIHDATVGLAWYQPRVRALHDRGVAFLERYPMSTRRWDVLVLLESGPIWRALPQRDGTFQYATDENASAAWRAAYYPRLEQLMASADASSSARGEALKQLLRYYRRRIRTHQEADAELAAGNAVRWFEDFERRYPTSGRVASLSVDVSVVLEAIDPRMAATFLEGVCARHHSDVFPDPEIRSYAEGRLRFVRGMLSSSADWWADLRQADPSIGDAARFRGKVILVVGAGFGYNSTMMQLNEWYSRYHSAGLEIVQVVQYNNADEHRHRLTIAEGKKYAQQRGWSWTFVWERQNSDFDRKWGLTSYPYMLLVNQDGRIVTECFPSSTADEILASCLRHPHGGVGQ